MAFKRHRHSRLIEAALDMTPLIDVIFLLVIFLLISTTFKKKQLALELNLPRAGKTEYRVSDVQHTLRVDEDGSMFLCPSEAIQKSEDTDALKCTTPMSKDKLLKELKSLANSHPGVRLGIYANASVSYHWIVKVVAAATEAGLDLHLPYETEGE